ncbi:MAG: hypothetical protein DHS20C18_52460 [Saprospiraceae bacterium]|nr:MAG: hypothetical protein DHS20C18_52460 [Saprospiraceae bacterium]
MNRLLLPLFLLFLMACNTETSTNDQQPDTSQPAAVNTAPVAAKAYPIVPKDTIALLWEKCDFIDVVFYYEDFSLSQHTQHDIRGSLGHISDQAAPVPAACKPIGRIFYQVDGENRLEADLFFTEGCRFLLFYENNQPTYANALSPDGINFFNNVFAKVKGGG